MIEIMKKYRSTLHGQNLKTRFVAAASKVVDKTNNLLIGFER